MMGLVKSEWIKLTSTRSAYWLLGLAIALGGGLAAVVAFGVKSLESSESGAGITFTMTVPLQLLGLVSINLAWIAAVISVTGEIRFSTLKTSFLVTPKRWPVVVAKTVVWVVLAAVTILLAAMLALLVAGAIAGKSDWTPFSGEGFALVMRFAAYTAIGTIGATGLAFVMRNAVGSVALLVVWQLAEVILPGIPKVGEKVAGYLPFANGMYWVQGEGYKGQISWDEPVALLYFAAVCALFWAAGLVLTMRRDA